MRPITVAFLVYEHMSKVKVELNLAGINELMKSGEVQEHLQKAGDAVASAAGSDYAATTHLASWVAITNVFPNSRKAAHENFKDNTLLKAVGAAGLST